MDSAADVVAMDTDVEVIPLADADASLVERYVARVGWDPSTLPGEWALLILTPRRMFAWNGPSEIEGRTIVRNGRWL